MPRVRRFDHVGITVGDLDVVTAFFVALGLEVEGRTCVEGQFLETVCGIPDSRTEIVMLKPTEEPAWSSRGSCGPTRFPAHRPLWPMSWDCATWPSRSTTCRRVSIGRVPRATDWSVASASTRALGEWRTSGGRKGSSCRWPNASAETPSGRGDAARVHRRPPAPTRGVRAYSPHGWTPTPSRCGRTKSAGLYICALSAVRCLA
jgi:catechol 2,3-dioxygenase-like lactoylglutathione lyase family enzyme